MKLWSFVAVFLLASNHAMACKTSLPWGATYEQLKAAGMVKTESGRQATHLPPFVSSDFSCKWVFSLQERVSGVSCRTVNDTSANGEQTAARFARQVKLLDKAFGVDPSKWFETVDAGVPAERYFARLQEDKAAALKLYRSKKHATLAALSVEPVSSSEGYLKLIFLPRFN